MCNGARHLLMVFTSGENLLGGEAEVRPKGCEGETPPHDRTVGVSPTGAVTGPPTVPSASRRLAR